MAIRPKWRAIDGKVTGKQIRPAIPLRQNGVPVAAEAVWSYPGQMFESLYQSFEDRADPSQGASRIAALRGELARLGLDGFLVPRADQHQNEYVAACEERLAWLSGFTGSAGLAIVLKASAAIFVDGRYSLAVKDQVDLSIFKPVAWSGRVLKIGSKQIFARGRGSATIPGCTPLTR